MDEIDVALHSSAASYVGSIINLDPHAKYANVQVSEAANGWRQVSYWIKSEKVNKDPHDVSYTMIGGNEGEDK